MPKSTKQLIFIIACPRSGTTILAALLNKHSQIASSTETHFFNHLAKLPVTKGLLADKAGFLDKWLEEPRVEDFCEVSKITKEQLKQKIHRQKPSEIKELFEILWTLFLEKKNKSIFCEKTPQHLNNVKEILELYPEAKFIHLCRDGRDVVNSLLKMPWRPRGLINNARFWRQYIQKGEEIKTLDQVLNISYEDLLQKPQGTLSKICDFLGLDFENTMLDFSRKDQIFSDWEDEWKSKASNPLDPSRIGAYKKELSKNEQIILNSFLKDLLLKNHYELDPKSKIGLKHYIQISSEYIQIFFTKFFSLFSILN